MKRTLKADNFTIAIPPSEEELQKNLEMEGKKLDISLKKRMFYWALIIVSVYLIFVAIVILFTDVSDSVIIALLTSTTATIIGLPYLIIHSLFPKEKIY